MSENQDRPSYGQEYGGGQGHGAGRGSGSHEAGGGYRAGSEYGQSPYGQPPYGQGAGGQQGQGSYGRHEAQGGYGAAPQQGGQGWQQPQQGAYPPPQSGQGWGQTPQQWGAPQQWQGQPGQPWQGQQWGGPVPEPQRPRSIMLSFWLIISAAIVMVGSTLMGALALTTPEGKALVEQTARQQLDASGVTGAEADQMMQTTLALLPGILITLALIALALYLLVAFRIRSGSRAARVVGTVLAVLSVLMLLTSLVGGAAGLEIVWVLLGVAGIVMAYRPDATEYMRQRAWAKTLGAR